MKNYNRIRAIRLSDKLWERLNELKDREETWERTFEELLNKVEEYDASMHRVS